MGGWRPGGAPGGGPARGGTLGCAYGPWDVQVAGEPKETGEEDKCGCW